MIVICHIRTSWIHQCSWKQAVLASFHCRLIIFLMEPFWMNDLPVIFEPWEAFTVTHTLAGWKKCGWSCSLNGSEGLVYKQLLFKLYWNFQKYKTKWKWRPFDFKVNVLPFETRWLQHWVTTLTFNLLCCIFSNFITAWFVVNEYL